MSKTIVEFIHIDKNKYNVKITGEPKKISGHRFVNLLDIPTSTKYKQLMLDFYGLRYNPATDNMRLGTLIEPACQEFAYGDYDYWTFEYFDYDGNVFGLYNEYGVCGLPDTIIPELNLMNENKMTTHKFDGVREEWVKQVQFYTYWWNKLVAGKNYNPEIKRIEITKYYVPKTLVTWHLQHLDQIVDENFEIFEIPLNTEQIEKDMEFAYNKRQEMIDSGIIEIDINRCKYLTNGLKQGLIRDKIKLKYDETDELLCSVIKPLLKEALDIKLKGKE